jgi:hypothetical protein
MASAIERAVVVTRGYDAKKESHAEVKSECETYQDSWPLGVLELSTSLKLTSI